MISFLLIISLRPAASVAEDVAKKKKARQR
jgi:hypothetical protein